MTAPRRIALLLGLALGLAGCGNDKSGAMTALPVKEILKAQIEKLKGAPAAAPAPVLEVDAATLAEGRKVLEATGSPVLSVSDPVLGIASFMTPIGTNSGVVTWANQGYQTVSMRDGVILATRGFVTDLMSSDAPTADRLRAGTGSYRRVNYVLDGADQTRPLEMTCSLSVSKNETITIIGKAYLTQRVDEACTGDAGSITNVYWFDATGTVRQSSQARSPGVENLQLQAIID